jgi:LacI family transcriptional regulator
MPSSKNRKRPTLNDIASRCNVNKGTVSRVLNGKFKNFSVSQTKLKEIKEAAKALGYKPNRMARVIRCNRTYLIGISFLRFQTPDKPNDLYESQELISFIRAMETHPLFEKYDCVLHFRHEIEGHPLTDLDFKSDLLEGLIYLVPSSKHNEFMELASPEFPIVLLGNIEGADKKMPCIDIDNRKAAKNAVKHLLEKGRKNIVMLVPENIRYVQCIKDRIQGYKDALKAAKIPASQQQIHCVPFDAESVHQFLSHMENFDSVDAIFCPSDELAASCIVALKNLNVRIPEDIALIGFDDSILSRMTSPTLSTVQRPFQEQAYKAIDTLLNILEKKIAYTPGFVEIETQLVKRESTEGITPAS